MKSKLFNSVILKFRNHAWNRIIIDKPETIKNLDSFVDPVYGFLWFLTTNPESLYKTYKHRRSFNFISKIIHPCSNSMSSHTPWYGLDRFRMFVSYITIQNCFLTIPKEVKIRFNNFSKIPNININIQRFSDLYLTKKESIYPLLHKNNLIFDNFNSYLQENKVSRTLHNCPICMKNLSSNKSIIVHSQCHNSFCSSCLMKWISCDKDSCPVCRKKIKVSDISFIESNSNKNPIDLPNSFHTIFLKRIQTSDKALVVYQNFDSKIQILSKQFKDAQLFLFILQLINTLFIKN